MCKRFFFGFTTFIFILQYCLEFLLVILTSLIGTIDRKTLLKIFFCIQKISFQSSAIIGIFVHIKRDWIPFNFIQCWVRQRETKLINSVQKYSYSAYSSAFLERCNYIWSSLFASVKIFIELFALFSIPPFVHSQFPVPSIFRY